MSSPMTQRERERELLFKRETEHLCHSMRMRTICNQPQIPCHTLVTDFFAPCFSVLGAEWTSGLLTEPN